MSEFDALAGRYIRQYVAKVLDVPDDQVEAYKFRASPGYEYSTATAEDFSCYIDVILVGGWERAVYVDEYELAEFLNGFAAIAAG